MSKAPHVHAAVIHAWADGAKIQYRASLEEGWVQTETPSWKHDIEYRVKPGVRRYRVALLCGYTAIVNDYEALEDTERRVDFTRWLTDWVEYEA